MLLKFFKSDRFYNPDLAFGRLFNKELEDWKNFVTLVMLMESLPLKKSGLLILKYDCTSHFNVKYLS